MLPQRDPLCRPAHDDPERIVRQWLLQRLRLIPRCAHPNVPLLVGRQDHRHGLVDPAIAANAPTHQGPKGATWR
jgi:hypothetical protein